MPFTEKQKLEVWNKATIVEGYDAARFRKDACGAWMKWEKYGDESDIYGWEIDHIYPVKRLKERGISDANIDNIVNLRALQWENNKSKGDDYPSYTAAIESEGNINIRKEQSFTVNESRQTKINGFFKL